MDNKYDDVLEKLADFDISKMKKAFPPVGDFHAANAVAFYGKDLIQSEYKRDYQYYKDVLRGTAKRLGLALCYGLGWKGLLGVNNNDENKAKKMHKAFFDNLPVLSKNMAKLLKETEKKLYLTNLIGRRLHVTKWASSDWKDKISARNSTLNYGIQSLGADVTKMILITVCNYIEKNRLYRYAGNLITKRFMRRIVTIDITDLDDLDIDEIEFKLDDLHTGHTKVILVKGDELISEYDRLVQIPMSVFKELNMKIFW